jgi:nitroreductase
MEKYTNETIQNLIERRSIRKYRSEQITDEQLNVILTAGSYAANAGSRQSPVMVVLQDKEIIERLGRLNRKVFYDTLNWKGEMGIVSANQPSIADDAKIGSAFYGAPTVITVFGPKIHPYLIEDCCLVIGNMMLAAHSLGIGSCYVARAHETFETDEGHEILRDWNIDDGYRAVAHCVLGYPDGETPKAKPRKEYVVKIIS